MRWALGSACFRNFLLSCISNEIYLFCPWQAICPAQECSVWLEGSCSAWILSQTLTGISENIISCSSGLCHRLFVCLISKVLLNESTFPFILLFWLQSFFGGRHVVAGPSITGSLQPLWIQLNKGAREHGKERNPSSFLPDGRRVKGRKRRLLPWGPYTWLSWRGCHIQEMGLHSLWPKWIWQQQSAWQSIYLSAKITNSINFTLWLMFSLIQPLVYVAEEVSVTGQNLNLQLKKKKQNWFFEGIELIGKMLLVAVWQFMPYCSHCAQGSGALPRFKEWGQAAALGANNLLFAWEFAWKPSLHRSKLLELTFPDISTTVNSLWRKLLHKDLFNSMKTCSEVCWPSL